MLVLRGVGKGSSSLRSGGAVGSLRGLGWSFRDRAGLDERRGC